MRAVGVLHTRGVFLQTILPTELENDPLREWAGTDVRLQLQTSCHHFVRGDHPADAQPGRYQLGKCSEDENSVGTIEGLDHQLGFSLKPHAAVWAVLDDVNASCLSQLS